MLLEENRAKLQFAIEAAGHVLKCDEDGKIDWLATDNGRFCNGPQCINCKYFLCEHCWNGYEIPKCGKAAK